MGVFGARRPPDHAQQARLDGPHPILWSAIEATSQVWTDPLRVSAGVERGTNLPVGYACERR